MAGVTLAVSPAILYLQCTVYALHSVGGISLVKGDRMRIRTETARVRIHCGPGSW
jgi:hypothetical protein